MRSQEDNSSNCALVDTHSKNYAGGHRALMPMRIEMELTSEASLSGRSEVRALPGSPLNPTKQPCSPNMQLTSKAKALTVCLPTVGVSVDSSTDKTWCADPVY